MTLITLSIFIIIVETIVILFLLGLHIHRLKENWELRHTNREALEALATRDTVADDYISHLEKKLQDRKERKEKTNV